MKKLFLALASIFSLILVLASCTVKEGVYLSYNQELTDDGLICTLSEDESYYSVTEAVRTVDENLVIPAQINSKPVKSIGYKAFYECTSIKSVVIPESVTIIEDHAFEECYWLESVIIPDSVTGIGDHAFSGCSRICNIEIPDNVTSIGAGVFYDCSSLESVEIPVSVTSVGSSAFKYCSALISVKIPDGVTSIDKGAFYGCFSLKSIEIPDSVTSIGDHAFSGCTSLESIEIPEGITCIDNNTFKYCTSLKSIKIPDSVTSIGEYAFGNCTSLFSVELGKSVKDISSLAFDGCQRLVEIINRSQLDITADSESYGYRCMTQFALEIHDGKSKIVNVDDYIFYTYDDENYFVGYIGDKADITLPESFNEECYVINQYALYDCDSLVSVVIPDGAVTSIDICAFERCDSLKSVVIGNGVTKIDSHVFTECSSLESVSFPFSVSDIDPIIFYRCSSLVNIEVDEENLDYKSIDGNLYTKDGKTIVHYAAGKTDNSFAIPDGVTRIGEFAFDSCKSLKSILIPKSVKYIDDNAFYCTQPEEIYYTGSERDWAGILIGEHHNDLHFAIKYYSYVPGN